MRSLRYKGAVYVAAEDKEESPDSYKERTGKCPNGMHTDAETKKCRPLQDLAKEGQTHILSHPEVSTIKDKDGITPLHYLADFGAEHNIARKVMKHPDVAKVKDSGGNTPLHILAMNGHRCILKHPAANEVTNDLGETPVDIYNSGG